MQERQRCAINPLNETWRFEMVIPSADSFQSKLTTPAKKRPEIPGKATSEAHVAHPVLSRLIEEVRSERSVEARYDRVHNRHNRGR